MKSLAERQTPAPARCPAAWRARPQCVRPSATLHARGAAQRERIDRAFGARVQRVGCEEAHGLPVRGGPERDRAGTAGTSWPSAIQRVAGPDIAGSVANTGYLTGIAWPGMTGELVAYNAYLNNQRAAYLANTGLPDPPAGHQLDAAAAGVHRFSERIVEQVDGFWTETREVDRQSNKLRAAVPAAGPVPQEIPVMGIPGAGPDIAINKPGGVTGIEAKAINTAVVGAVNARILAADAQLGGFMLNRAKVLIEIMHVANEWPGAVPGHGSFATRANDAALEGAIDAQLNSMALPNTDKVTVLNVNTNYGGPADVVADGGDGNWASQVL